MDSSVRHRVSKRERRGNKSGERKNWKITWWLITWDACQVKLTANLWCLHARLCTLAQVFDFCHISCGLKPVVECISCLLCVCGGKAVFHAHTRCHAHKLNSADGKHETQINVVLWEDVCQRAFSSWRLFLFPSSQSHILKVRIGQTYRGSALAGQTVIPHGTLSCTVRC